MKYLVIAVAIPLVLVLIAYAYFGTPSVYVESSAHGATIHCEVLHDYPSDVERIEITETTTGKIVWSVKAQGEMFQLHKFNLTRGWNVETLQPYSGQFQTSIPQQGPFYLQSGTGYRASVCSSGWFSICRTATFTL
jgi:hypothetical protein